MKSWRILAAGAVGAMAMLVASPAAHAENATDFLGAQGAGVVSYSANPDTFESECAPAPVDAGTPAFPGGAGTWTVEGALTPGLDVVRTTVGCRAFQDGAMIAQIWSGWVNGPAAGAPSAQQPTQAVYAIPNGDPIIYCVNITADFTTGDHLSSWSGPPTDNFFCQTHNG